MRPILFEGNELTTLLALDASTDACVVALRHQGRDYLETDDTPRMHARRMLPMVSTILEKAGLSPQDVDALAVGIGPGSFTGIRIAVGLAQGMALGLDCPVHPVCSLAAAAWSVARSHAGTPVALIRDARMGEHYVGVFVWENESLKVLLPPQLSPHEATGALLKLWSPLLAGDEGQAVWPDGTALLELAATVPAVRPDALEPAYLRGHDAWKKMDTPKGH